MKKSIAIILTALTMVGLASCMRREYDPYYVGDTHYAADAPNEAQ